MPNNLHELADNKTPEELAAEIASTAANLGGHSPKDKDAINDDGKIPPEAIDVETQPATTEPKTDDSVEVKTAAPTDNTDEKSESITVKVEPRAAAEKPAELPEQEQTEVVENTEKSTISHSGKTIQPISEQPDQTETQVAVSSEAKAEPAQEPEPEPVPEPEASVEVREEKPEAATKLNTLTEELNEKEKLKQSSDQQQQAKVFDTNQYHLPIKPGKHHRKGMHTWMWLLVLAAVVLVAVGYLFVNQIGPFSGVGDGFLGLISR